MKLAIFSDVHGNLVALETVLDAIERAGVDHIVCLGDIAALGSQPNECITRLQAFQVVMGNTDEWLLSPKVEPKWQDSEITQIELWCAEQLTENSRAILGRLPSTIEIALEADISLLCYHGSPASYNERVMPTTPIEDLERMFGTYRAKVYAGGHIHEQFVRRYKEAFILNPGSVGLPYQYRYDETTVENPAWAEYAIVTWRQGAVEVSLRRVAVDVEEIIRRAQASTMPQQEWWIKEWAR